MPQLPQGFQAAGVHCGIKTDPSKPDIALIVSDEPVSAAGVYTQNLVCAAPVLLDRERTPSDQIRAVITNSGNANACTGEQGKKDCQSMTELTAAACDIAPEQVLVMSTGIIGHTLDMQKIENGINDAATQLASDTNALNAAAAGIMTTDTVEKIASTTISLGSETAMVTGIAKGSGMISPNMATMLAVVMTDASLTAEQAQSILNQATARSFNRISVDGHASTNDTLLLLASGKVGEALTSEQLAEVQNAVEQVCIDLAKAIVNDGEGAEHLIEIKVTGCESEADAETICRAIANSPLVKTAVTGCDPNWGRIVSAAGYAGPKFEPTNVSLSMNGVRIYDQGAPLEFDAEGVSQTMRDNRTVLIELSVGTGPGKCTFWTCDLTTGYVHINADYST
ncbi:MAG: bifunctional glutamate N-acetyltransferase/amino-acid acetyltransferase ArgJ [Planctomycetota bacterium]